MTDHPRACPHGHQLGKCDTCDLFAAEAELQTARELLRRWLEGLEVGVVFKLPADTREFLGGGE